MAAASSHKRGEAAPLGRQCRWPGSRGEALATAESPGTPYVILALEERAEEGCARVRLAGMHALLFANINQLEKELSAFCPSALGPKAHGRNKTSGGDAR